MDLRSPQSPYGWVPGRLIMASSTTGQHTLLLAEASTGFRRGQVWQVHVAFSGAIQHRVERTVYGRTYLGGGELLQAGEVVLGPWRGLSLTVGGVGLGRRARCRGRAAASAS